MQGSSPIAFYGPMGATTLRVVETNTSNATKGQQQSQGAALKTNNKKGIVAVAALTGGASQAAPLAAGQMAGCTTCTAGIAEQ